MSTEHFTEEPGDTSANAAPNTATEAAPVDPLLEALQEAAKYRDLALRGQADFDNFRKRAAREKEDAIRFANARLFENLLPILDNFELGLAAARQDAQGSSILLGLDMVFKQTQDFLTDHGISAIEAVGQKFDPNLHEALAQEPSADAPEGTVLRQIRKGYKLRDRLIRPANVVVSTGASVPEESVTVSPEAPGL